MQDFEDYFDVPVFNTTNDMTMPFSQMTSPYNSFQSVGNMQMPSMQMPNMQGMADKAMADPYTYPGNVKMALQLIKEAVEGENEDRMFYGYLLENAPKEDKEIIAGIRNDEMGHFGLFRTLYRELTGQMLPPPQDVPFEKPESYCQGLGKSIIGETNAVRKYRNILYAMMDRRMINIVTGIITDEIRHAALYNYLYAKNNCKA